MCGFMSFLFYYLLLCSLAPVVHIFKMIVGRNSLAVNCPSSELPPGETQVPILVRLNCIFLCSQKNRKIGL